MKKAFIAAMVLLLLLAGCDREKVSLKGDADPAKETAASTPKSTSEITPEPSQAVEQTPGPVVMPAQLLSADEATELTGHVITIDESSAYEDSKHGVVSLRYVYDINNTTIHALLQIEEDALKPVDELKDGFSARDSFDYEQNFSKDDITAVEDLGDAAFTFDDTGQLHMVYEGYYIVVAFEKDEYDSSQSGPLNVLLGRRILVNLQAILAGQ